MMEIAYTMKRRYTGFTIFSSNFRFLLIGLIGKGFSELLYFILVWIWPYRQKVISRNIKIAFPTISKQDHDRYGRSYYRHLSDLIIEPFLFNLCNKRHLSRLIEFDNLNLLSNLLADGKDVVLMGSHYGNWEYLSILGETTETEVVVAYSPLRNSWLNKRLLKVRSRFGMTLVPKQEWYRASLKYVSKRPTIFLAIADQRPKTATKESVEFLNKKTYIQCGAARLACHRQSAVVYLDVIKTARNTYRYRFVEITKRAESIAPIIESYHQLLEASIHRQPELWLWSHNRWKFD